MGIGEIDLIAGGPPCQGYSGIGHRRSYRVEKKEIPSNYLFKEMSRIISFLRPKMFLFENVKGLLSARWTADGIKGEIWEAVQAEFRSINKSKSNPEGEYFVDFQLVQAKDYGVPQNRPRVLMVGVRRDLGWIPNRQLPASGLLPKPTGNPPDIIDVLSDLVDPDYLQKKVTDRYVSPPFNKIQRWLRTWPDGHVEGKGGRLTEQVYSDHAPNIREKFQHMLDHNGEIPEHMRTKKFAQRVLPKTWDERGPTITVTSLPEDYVHYCQPRSLTVREWARLQMFPDWYEFKGPRTTGGIRRAGNPHKGIWEREVPKYTQIGNAVPVGLAHRVGEHLAGILKSLSK
jgi:DNA (cytosine-5)-methyltransferase 1